MNAPSHSRVAPLVSLGLMGTVLALLGSCASEQINIPTPPRAGETTTAPSRTYRYDHTLATQPARFKDRKPVVSLLRVGDITEFGQILPFGRGGQEPPAELPMAVRQQLLADLVTSRELFVVDRERIVEILREQTFAASQHADPATAAKRGKLIGVHYILEGAFYPAGSDLAVHVAAAQPGARAAGAPSAAAMVVIYLNVYDVETGQVKAVGKGVSPNLAMASRQAVADMIGKLGNSPPAIRVVSFDDKGNAVLDVGSGDGVKEGSRFTVARPEGKPVVLEVWKVDPLSCVAKFLQGSSADVSPNAVAHRGREKAEPAGSSALP